MEPNKILLSRLNNALRRLRGACTELNNYEIDTKILDVMRRLLLAEVLADKWIITVGGSQSAGKTTLVACMYELFNGENSWLRSNEGRGEKMPILIMEENGLDEPKGYVKRLIKKEEFDEYRLLDEPADLEDFHKAIYDPKPEDLLPVLKVPQRYFKRDNQAWLLLPGYEKIDRDNKSWQQLMRQAMLSAGGQIVVTDETRMANSQQVEIAKDMLENELKDATPYIVISKTESYRNIPQKRKELIDTALSIFRVNQNLTESNIILSGSDDPQYVEEWLPLLRNAIDDLNFAGQTKRNSEMKYLTRIISEDLVSVLNEITVQSRIYFANKKIDGLDGGEKLVDFLEIFDDAVDELRLEHEDLVKYLVGNTYHSAIKIMRQKLIEEHEGFKNWLANTFDSTSETTQKMTRLVQSSWEEAAYSIFEEYSEQLSNLTIKKLMPEDEIDSSQINKISISEDKLNKLVKLGYFHKSGSPVSFKKINPNIANDIAIILGHRSVDTNTDLSKESNQSVKLIPLISLEYARIIYLFPKLFNASNSSFQIDENYDATREIEESIGNWAKGVELGKTALYSITTILALDIISDGKSQIIDAIKPNNSIPTDATVPKANIPIVPHPAAIAVTALLAAVYVTASTLTRIRCFEKKISAQAENMMASVHDNHIQIFQKNFDATMKLSRKKLIEKLRARYNMDENLMRKDRLLRAIGEVETLTKDLRYQLESSPIGLEILTP